MHEVQDRGHENTTAVILAGGFGSRLRPIISDKPKIIVEIQGRPFVTYLLDHIIAAGFQEVILCTGYMSGLVKSEIGDKYKNLQIRYSEETKPLGTGGALRQALPLIKTSKIMVMNGDSYVGIDYRILLQEVHRMT